MTFRLFTSSSTITGELTSSSLRLKDQKQFRYIKPNKAFNYEMFTNQNRNWAYKNGLSKFLDDIKSVDQKYHQSLIHSFHWYSEAIKEIGIDSELFYIKMVSCVESLISNVEWKDKLEEKINSILKREIFTENEKQELRNWLLNRKIKQKFVKFIDNYSEGFYKSGYRKAKHCYIKKTDSTKYLKRIYDARSAYIHTGKPMYISYDMNIGGDSSDNKCHFWDLDPTQGKMIDRKEIKGKEKLPRPRWFERLVNYSLKRFIEQKLY